MQREDAMRAAAGAAVLLIPFIGVYAALPLAALFAMDRGTRMLTASLMLLLLMRPALALTQLNFPLYIVAISFIAPTFAYLASKRFEILPGSIVYLMTTIALGYPVASAVAGGSLSPEKVLFLAMLGGLSGAFLEHVSSERDFAVPFGTCMVMWLFSFDYPLPELGRILLITIFALALGLGAYWAKAADADAVLSETLICLLIIIFSGPSWFLLLLSFYLMGGAFTKYGYAKKHKMGIAQSKGGVRGFKNVYSNSLVPLALAVCHGIYGSDLFIYAFIGAVATANGDTLASEIGETSRSMPRMITTLKPVDPGLDGGVTPLGESASLVGAAVVGILAVITGMTGFYGMVTAIIGGFLGTNFDSLLGATLQRRGVLSNNGVNLFATLFGAIVGALIWAVL
ncbi:MAG TPA: TIGR00297 family protein [Methanotrichaceae archaeon]|nr:TIGR00297 family protein [Methanotrichaceae archaeon]